MLPGEVARLGSHSFMILGQEDENHIIAEHRSGTPPHNYQFLLRVRLDKNEMDQYKEILKDSKTLPAFTTIYFDENGKQLDRTFFCLADLPRIFGDKKKSGDEFEKLFPIRASLQKNPDHEGGFDIEKSVARGKYISLNRDDVELLVYRYLPAYLPQDLLRKAIQEKKEQIIPLLSHAPISQNEEIALASQRKSYMTVDGSIFSKEKMCPKNFYLKNTPVPESNHAFLIMGEIDKNTVLAVHYYDEAPQNFQTALQFKLTNEQMKSYREAKKGTTVPPFLLTGSDNTFCMEDIRKLVKTKGFFIKGKLYKNTELNAYKLGEAISDLKIESPNIEVLVNRRLESFMNPLEVVADVTKGASKSLKNKASRSDY